MKQMLAFINKWGAFIGIALAVIFFFVDYETAAVWFKSNIDSVYLEIAKKSRNGIESSTFSLLFLLAVVVFLGWVGDTERNLERAARKVREKILDTRQGEEQEDEELAEEDLAFNLGRLEERLFREGKGLLSEIATTKKLLAFLKVMLFGGLALLLYFSEKGVYINEKIDNYEQELLIISPVLTYQERAVFNSYYSLIDSKIKYDELMQKLRTIKEERKKELEKQQKELLLL